MVDRIARRKNFGWTLFNGVVIALALFLLALVVGIGAVLLVGIQDPPPTGPRQKQPVSYVVFINNSVDDITVSLGMDDVLVKGNTSFRGSKQFTAWPGSFVGVTVAGSRKPLAVKVQSGKSSGEVTVVYP